MNDKIKGFIKLKINEVTLERQFECNNLKIENNSMKFFNVIFTVCGKSGGKVIGKYSKHEFDLRNVIEFTM